MEMHFATIWEHVTDLMGDHTALIHGNDKRSWREYDDRAARVAGALTERGFGVDTKVGMYMYNCNEYLEVQYAAFKMRGSPINVNYRYMNNELLYLLENADVEVVFYHACFADRISAIKDQLPDVKLYVQVGDGSETPLLEGSIDYEQLIADSEPMPRITRDEKDIYMLYTGGTTGMPKGVMYEMHELCRGLLMGFELSGIAPPESPEAIIEEVVKLKAAGANPVSLVGCPLMHGTGVWLGAMAMMHMGGTVVTVPNRRLDCHAIWNAVQTHGVNNIIIVGDAFAKPMIKALDEAVSDGKPYDLSSIRMIASSGVMWTTEVKRKLLEHVDTMLIDVLGATEGSMGKSITTRANIATTAKFMINDTSKVFNDDWQEVKPGSGEIGRVANGSFSPVGYYKDPKKSAGTFVVVEGHRYSIPGDFATVEADGSISLLGRGSMCINTKGEKVFPEEVEEAIKKNPAVYDCLVAGVKDPDFGERITALVSIADNAAVSAEAIIAALEGEISGYKKPRNVFIVDEVKRAVNGKADYRWAKDTAAERFAGLAG